MRSTARRVATLATIILALSGCGVNDSDIEHWKHTQRGPRKITTVLVESRYPQPLRVHAARALIEMKHPNASGLDLLQGALQSMSVADREPIVHALVPELQNMMGTGSGAAPAPAAAQGPTEQMIKAKDAAYILLRGDGRTSFANPDDRATLANAVLDWVLADFNNRALAGSYTAEQIVTAIGPSAADRLGQAIAFSEQAIPVTVEVAKLVNAVAAPAGKQAVAARVVGVATEVEGAGGTERLRTIAGDLLRRNQREATPERVNAAAEQLRNSYLTVLFEALKTLGQPAGTDYLLRVASNAATPLDRRKTALTAAAGTINASHTQTLLGVANCAAGPTCDVELKGIAIDRLGETRDRALLPQLFTLFDAANGTAADGGFIVRWKLGEAIIRLGGASVLPEFMQHLGTPRPASANFAGYTFAELNGEAQAIGDISPPPRDAMRAYLANNHPVPARLLAMMFLGIKGEQQDLARLQAFTSETTPIQGEGWNDPQLQLTTVGAVANRTLQGLQQVLRQGQQVNPGAPAQR